MKQVLIGSFLCVVYLIILGFECLGRSKWNGND
jgi:hypothetical protein